MYKRAEKAGRHRKLVRRFFICLMSFSIGCFFMIIALPNIRVRAVEEDSVSGNDAEITGRVDEITVSEAENPAAVWEEPFAEAQKELTEPVERCDILVALDPGHGGEDEGCSREGVQEKDINLSIAKAVEAKLSELGYRVLLVRDSDTDSKVSERVQLANEGMADIYVSIHQNACDEKESDIAGIETWYNETKGDGGSRRLAGLLHDNMLRVSKAADRGLVPDEKLYVVRETDMPACLVETGFLSNRAERELLVTGEYQEKLAEAIVTGIDLYFFPKTMYLTFDDGPTAENTDAVLDILKEHEIRATFFLVGESVRKYPDVVKRIAAEGHTIGIHCDNHDYKKLYAGVDSYIEDFEKAREAVYEAAGVEVKLFRFPGGSINTYNRGVYQDIIEAMTERGYIYFDWNASLEDASKHNEPERLLKTAKESTFGRRRVVMLAHDTVDNTVSCLEDLIEQFPEYRMLPLDENVEPVQF